VPGNGVRSAKGVYEVPLHRQSILGLGIGQPFPLADAFAASHLCLPMWKGLTDTDADRVIEAVNGWAGRGGAGETVNVADATLIAAHLARVDWDRVSTLDTCRYAPDYLPAATADRLPWSAFADAVPTLLRGSIDGADLDVVIVPKSLTWSDRDVNVYAGSPAGPPLRSYLDLSEHAFVAVFAWHIAVARELSVALGCDVYVTHGFNPQDSSPDRAAACAWLLLEHDQVLASIEAAGGILGGAVDVLGDLCWVAERLEAHRHEHSEDFARL
jgi:hypothetical protein